MYIYLSSQRLDIFSIKQNWNWTSNVQTFYGNFPFCTSPIKWKFRIKHVTTQPLWWCENTESFNFFFFFLLRSLKLLLFILASFSYSILSVTEWNFEKYQKKTHKKCHVTSWGTKKKREKKWYDVTCFSSGFLSSIKICVYICIPKPVR